MITMTPKEKAEELVEKFLNAKSHKMSDYSTIYTPTAKVCALITVDEVIAQIEPSVSMDVIESRIRYWERVKQEIEKL
jgi:hypothetical protein